MQHLLCLISAILLSSILALPPVKPVDRQRADVPRASDPRLEVTLFAAAPDIVHPIGIDFDSKGRLLVIESHTHFPPGDYKGPKHDRIRILEDTDGDGKADKFTTFFEGTRATMDIAVHPDGSVYLATRNEILRLRDSKGDGKADIKERLVFLETKGDYPHNGLSGLCFDSRGDLYFGMGENLGASYKLIGSDGTTIADGGEGGNIFWCTVDGKKLRRVATGFWNPFGICRDITGRLFAVDNDPDSMPPCRMLQVVEGGDYGFQFRYGRAGRHPFQAWNGQLPGTLPYMTGTGEAPCEVLSYESDGLPREYLGNLLVTSWADHRVERYVLRQQGSSFLADRKPFVQGGANFRPVGLAVAPDGSLFVSDWVLSNYNLHGKGAIWHIRSKEDRKPHRPDEPRRALASAHRPLREAAARKLAADETGREFLRRKLSSEDLRVRAASLTALIDQGDRKLDLAAFAGKERDIGLRALAVRTLAERGEDVRDYLHSSQPAELRREAIGCLRTRADAPQLVQLLGSTDPFMRHATIQQLGRYPHVLDAVEWRKLGEIHRGGVLLAHRASGRTASKRLLPSFLADSSEEVRFLAAKWIADLNLGEYRPLLIESLKDRKLNVRLFAAYSTAVARIDGQEVNEGKLADYFMTRLTDQQSPSPLRVLALQMVPASHPKVTIDLLSKLLARNDPLLQREAVRTLSEHPAVTKRTAILLDAARNQQLPEAVRAEAIVGLSEKSQEVLDDLLRFARSDKATLRDEALRALVQTKLSETQRKELEPLARRHPESADLVARVLGKPFVKARPGMKDLDDWLTRLEGPADPDAGRRVFFHSKLAGCYRCHRVEGRGHDVGPDLSTTGLNERRHILESILQPSALIAPHYQTWHIETTEGKVLSGMLLHTNLDEYTYLDAKGEKFKLNTRNIAESKPSPVSIMPEGLADQLTDQEMRDLLAYLCSRR
jgi:putative membrane-bound dehydrogenase-like protein